MRSMYTCNVTIFSTLNVLQLQHSDFRDSTFLLIQEMHREIAIPVHTSIKLNSMNM